MRKELELLIHTFNSSYGPHGFDHTLRVFEMCRYLGNKLSADLSILLPAALLHDIAREKPDHSIKGAKIAEEILT